MIEEDGASRECGIKGRRNAVVSSRIKENGHGLHDGLSSFPSNELRLSALQLSLSRPSINTVRYAMPFHASGVAKLSILRSIEQHHAESHLLGLTTNIMLVLFSYRDKRDEAKRRVTSIAGENRALIIFGSTPRTHFIVMLGKR